MERRLRAHHRLDLERFPQLVFLLLRKVCRYDLEIYAFGRLLHALNLKNQPRLLDPASPP